MTSLLCRAETAAQRCNVHAYAREFCKNHTEFLNKLSLRALWLSYGKDDTFARENAKKYGIDMIL
ncbi:hypothetical protein CBW42_07005 [Butyricicoccus porcorum]|uniref:Uncharacterized protein n=1 Tax=Butyricicoccus porcorum TaxID=1945634 RepID=A0A252F4C0_9FIRM|nr:hypothetical protein CBW42_07005 [Butyricicoccus porcorum]